MKNFWIINPAAGDRDCTAQALIRRAYVPGSGDAAVFRSDTAGAIERFVRAQCRAFAAEPLSFFVCGGDGTLHETINGAIGWAQARIIGLPFGRCNRILRQVNAPAFQSAGGRSHRCALLRVNGRYCFSLRHPADLRGGWHAAALLLHQRYCPEHTVRTLADGAELSGCCMEIRPAPPLMAADAFRPNGPLELRMADAKKYRLTDAMHWVRTRRAALFSEQPFEMQMDGEPFTDAHFVVESYPNAVQLFRMDDPDLGKDTKKLDGRACK